MSDSQAQLSAPQVARSPDIYVRLFSVLRIFTGLVWLSNGLAKVFERSNFDWGVFSFNLVDRSVARSILQGAAHATHVHLLGSFYDTVVLAHWGPWAGFLTVSELAIGLGLLIGVASRLAAVGGLLLIGPVWIMLWHTNLYLWEYPAEDLLPLVLLVIAPAGRYLGLDGSLRIRFGRRWPG